MERVRIMNKAGTLMSMAQFGIGDRVQWTGSDGIQRIGGHFSYQPQNRFGQGE